MIRHRVSTIELALIASLLVLVDAWQVSAAEVTMSGNVLPPAALGSITPTGSGRTNDPYTYAFSTTNGLDMGTHKIYGNNASNKNVTLDLNGGSITATTPAANASIDLKGTLANCYPAGISIVHAGNIHLGRIWTASDRQWDTVGAAGSVAIGQDTDGQRVGKVEVSEILAYNRGVYDGNNAGSVMISSTNDVFVWDGAAAGDIDTSIASGYYDAGGMPGSVTVKHEGSFRVRTVKTTNGTRKFHSGRVVLNGDVMGNGTGGDCQIETLDTRNLGASYNKVAAGDVAVTGYANVAVSNLLACNEGTTDIQNGGVITIAASGNISIGSSGICAYAKSTYSSTGGVASLVCGGEISIGGGIDLNGATDGALSLVSSNGGITLASLDLDRMSTATLSSAQRCEVTGTVANFSTNYTSGAGSQSSPFVTTQTKLRLPAGQRLMYHADVPGNAYLGGVAYRVASPAGVAGAGGVVMKYQSKGTVITIK
ncbi:MAG: hypothetical protein C0404_06370 [Verrucomicrobia bacterium]|nr:hypothetical protein [Verrucomicrobiota bacterium]